MARRKRRSGISLERTQDPGKDLFAYLFLMIMVFSFMLLMSTEERQSRMPGQNAPLRHSPAARSALTAVHTDKLGRLVKKDRRLYLQFGKSLYLTTDMDRLTSDNRIAVTADPNGGKRRVLYLEEDQEDRVLLSEYLTAFQHLSYKGIGVAFAERVK